MRHKETLIHRLQPQFIWGIEREALILFTVSHVRILQGCFVAAERSKEMGL
jgi:hypothetical protein